MPPRKRNGAQKTSSKSKWDAEAIVSDPKSPLAKADLRSILSNPAAWTSLDQQEKTLVLSLFPDSSHVLDVGTENARPNLESLMNDDGFRADCAAYIDNLSEGRHDVEWLLDAWTAHKKRAAGEFDDYLAKKVEQDWGVALTDPTKPESTNDEETVPLSPPKSTIMVCQHHPDLNASRFSPETTQRKTKSEASEGEMQETIVASNAPGA